MLTLGGGLRIRFADAGDDRLAAKAPTYWRKKAERMRFPKDRRLELVAGGLVAEMLGFESVEIELEPGGKPVLVGHPEIHFSISHSDDVVMCVVAGHRVGCDVEKVVNLPADISNLVGSIFEWTLREAKFKCGDKVSSVRNVPAPVGYAAAVAEEVKSLI